MARLTLPLTALEWLVGEQTESVLLVDPVATVVTDLLDAGRRVIAVGSEPDRAVRLATRFGRQHDLLNLVGRPDQLPVQPCIAEVVLLCSGLGNPVGSTPLDRRQAHGQMSRALQPGGWVAGWQIIRDDSVPWVRRLIRLMRSVDPSAMSAQADHTHRELLASKYFPQTERRDFRLWVPVNRAGMIEMVASQPAVARLNDRRRSEMLGEAGQIFDNSSSLGELRLPYQLQCWRAHTDHHELTQPITFSDGALVIPL